MSSIATFYILPGAKRASYDEAKRKEKTVTWKRGIFGIGRREVITGDRYLWEYLDLEASAKHSFDQSGFVIVDYFLTFVQLPEPLQGQLAAATSRDGHYFHFEHSLAAALAGYLEAHPPSLTDLAKFASEQGHPADEYAPSLAASHDTLMGWLRSISASQFGVLHLTF